MLPAKPLTPGTQLPRCTNSYEEYINTENLDISVVGRLSAGVDHMRTLGASQYYLSIAKFGYALPLYRDVPAYFQRNNKSAREDMDYVRSAVDALLATGAVVELEQPPIVSNPLTVANKAGKKRLVLDLRYINDHLNISKCKLEGAETLLKTLRPNDFMITFDLKSCYHHILMCNQHSTLLGFTVTDTDNEPHFYKFKVMPFGLATATYVFTKMIRQFIKAWRARGINVVVFVDDGIVTATDRETLLLHAKIIKADLLAAGWVPHKDKCNWTPSQCVDWLGMTYDTSHNLVKATPAKVTAVMSLLPNLLTTNTVHVKSIASVVGKLISMFLAYGDIIYLRIKCLQMQIATTLTWSEHVRLSERARQEINFWLAYLPTNNGMPLLVPADASVITFSDASGTGLGAISSLGPETENILTHRTFTPAERSSSSSHRELLAIAYSINQASSEQSCTLVHR